MEWRVFRGATRPYPTPIREQAHSIRSTEFSENPYRFFVGLQECDAMILAGGTLLTWLRKVNSQLTLLNSIPAHLTLSGCQQYLHHAHLMPTTCAEPCLLAT